MAEKDAAKKLALASRILAQHEIVDAFGHISCRSPVDPDHFLISRNLAPALVKPCDIITYKINSQDASPVDPNAPRGFVERHIHAQLYKKYPGIKAVVHCHAAELIPFGLDSNISFVAVSHMAGFIGSTGTPIFDIAEKFGENTDMLIRNSQHGAELASKFEPSQNSDVPSSHLVLMRGHGTTIWAESIELAVYKAIYTVFNARILMNAKILGSQIPKSLSENESIKTYESNSGQIHRPWDMWVLELGENANF